MNLVATPASSGRDENNHGEDEAEALWTHVVENMQYAWAYLWSGRTFAIALGIVFAMVAIGLLIASRTTRWGRAKPLTKCVVLSIIAHIWLLLYASGTRVMLPQGDPNGAMNSAAVSLDATRLEPAGPITSLAELPLESIEDPTQSEASLPGPLSAWEKPLDTSQMPTLDVMSGAPAIDAQLSQLDLLSSLTPEPMPPLPAEPPQEPPVAPSPAILQAPIDPLLADNAQPDDGLKDLLQPASAIPNNLAHDTASPPAPLASTNGLTQPNANAAALHTVSSRPLPVPTKEALPAEYQLRVAADRLELARPFGADQDTEAAVSAALFWLAKVQSADGGWNAKEHGAGTETYALGENRSGTGDRADTGVTGLALLAFLSGGHTHIDGQHKLVVMRGLEFLIRSQMPSGDLSGPKQIGNDASVTNARMYCHGIAMLSMAEAYAMTHDPALREPLARALAYTLKAQDPRTGGWRYRPGDAGDLSQFGWQAMALRSAERSGIAIEPIVKQRMRMFLDSCAAGTHGGLARYKPREGSPSVTMTAEALACRLLLNERSTLAAQMEARNALLSNLPGTSEENVYYWYYATLALFQLQDESWRKWNLAMKKQLVDTQRPIYESDAGSWNPDRLWGGYGGRVYSTAMSCLCLEVYYRYLPLYR